MAGRYSGSYLNRWNDWRIVAIPADIGQASLVERIPKTGYHRPLELRCWVETKGRELLNGKEA